MPKPRLWLFLLMIGVVWYMYETYHTLLWDTVQEYTGGAKRAGYFLIGGIILYSLLFQRDLLSGVFEKMASLDNDPRLNTVNLISSSQNYSMPGTRTKHKRNVTNLMKKKIAASQQWKCGSCSRVLDETYEVDHKTALEHGGTNDPSNLWALCPHCHRKKTVNERLF